MVEPGLPTGVDVEKPSIKQGDTWAPIILTASWRELEEEIQISHGFINFSKGVRKEPGLSCMLSDPHGALHEHAVLPVKMNGVGGMVVEEVLVEASTCWQDSAVRGHRKVQKTTADRGVDPPEDPDVGRSQLGIVDVKFKRPVNVVEYNATMKVERTNNKKFEIYDSCWWMGRVWKGCKSGCWYYARQWRAEVWKINSMGKKRELKQWW